MTTLKKYCEENGLDINKAFDMVVGNGGGILPQKGGFTGYFAEITDTSIICTNDKLGVKKEIPFEELPEDWVCPLCGEPKSVFTQE